LKIEYLLYRCALSLSKWAEFIYSTFDLPEADKCLLASGELDVQCSMFISFLFDLTGRLQLSAVLV